MKHLIGKKKSEEICAGDSDRMPDGDAMPNDEITITLSDKKGRLSAETLRLALEHALRMLHAIETDFVARDADVRWDIIRVRMQSPLTMTFSPQVRVKGRARPAIGRKIVKTAWQGMEKIERGATPPHAFGEDALDAAKKLVKSAAADGTSVAISANGSGKIKLTEKTIKNVDEIVAKARLYVDFSTIEGRLEIVSVHDGKSIVIWETMTRNKVECTLTDEQFDSAVAMLGKRVAVTGRVHYRNHVPRTINVEEPIRLLRDMKDLPQPKTVGAIDITGGLSSEDHIRRMRDG
jgi:hypothetical protein